MVSYDKFLKSCFSHSSSNDVSLGFVKDFCLPKSSRIDQSGGITFDVSYFKTCSFVEYDRLLAFSFLIRKLRKSITDWLKIFQKLQNEQLLQVILKRDKSYLIFEWFNSMCSLTCLLI